MLLSDLQSKDIINLTDGKRIGTIVDVDIEESGKIKELTVQKRKFLFFSSSAIGIKWENIDKIGKDVILVNVDD